MAEIFAIFVGAIGAVIYRKRTLAISLILLGLLCTLLMFWHHVSDKLPINL